MSRFEDNAASMLVRQAVVLQKCRRLVRTVDEILSAKSYEKRVEAFLWHEKTLRSHSSLSKTQFKYCNGKPPKGKKRFSLLRTAV